VSGLRRIIVGTSGSPGSLRALRYAENLARASGAVLMPVLAWTPPGGDLADRRCPCGYLRRIWAEDAAERLRDALGTAWGCIPDDLTVRPCVQRGEAGRVLADIASDRGDLLIVGAGHRGAVARTVYGRVSRYCLAHARCPVLAVPPAALAHEIGPGPLRWAFWHRTLTTDRILRDQGKPAA
jgi:nucleotide-binding universal stress UspA family protein